MNGLIIKDGVEIFGDFGKLRLKSRNFDGIQFVNIFACCIIIALHTV